MYNIPDLPLPYAFDSVDILKQLNRASRQLAQLNGIAHTIPNEHLLISSLALQEARSSSAVENIVTTHDDLYKNDLVNDTHSFSPATKEVFKYRGAISSGFKLVRQNKLLTCNIIKAIQKELEGNDAGFIASESKVLKNDSTGQTIYTPPHDMDYIIDRMNNLERFINDPSLSDLDPLIKMAIIHHQFESIHPFGDGNGRTGRIVNILYLVVSDLLDVPVLYFSRYIIQNKPEYYRLIQAILDASSPVENERRWNDWVLFMLKGIEETATTTIELVSGISSLMAEFKPILRDAFGKSYKHEMLNNLFTHPYTKIKYMSQDMNVDRRTASDYLDRIVSLGLLDKKRLGRENYYINTRLYDLFLSVGEAENKNMS